MLSRNLIVLTCECDVDIQRLFSNAPSLADKMLWRSSVFRSRACFIHCNWRHIITSYIEYAIPT